MALLLRIFFLNYYTWHDRCLHTKETFRSQYLSKKTYLVQTSSGNKYNAQYKQMQPSKDYNAFRKEQGNEGLYLNQGETTGHSI